MCITGSDFDYSQKDACGGAGYFRVDGIYVMAIVLRLADIRLFWSGLLLVIWYWNTEPFLYCKKKILLKLGVH